MSLSPATRLGPYEILAPLGAGGMGEVYRATDTRLGRTVALKVLPEAFTADPERLARFEREARLLASLNHPSIAHLYGFETAPRGEGSTVRLIAMELAEGEDLATRLRRGAVPVEEAIDIARQIAEALEAAHEKGIVHRDLKPANVKVAPDGTVKVLDFGLAKAWAGEGTAAAAADLAQSPTLTTPGTVTGTILGTAEYMSPEQARGKAVDKRADIWAFGVVLFEMLTGRRLFACETASDTLAAVLKSDPDWSALPGATPAPVKRVLRRCLQRDVRLRLHDIADARIELTEHETEAAAAPGVAPARRAGALLFSAVAVLALATAVLGVLALRSRGPAPEPVETRPLTYSGHDRAPAASPDGRIVAFTSDRDGIAKIWLEEVAGGGEAALTSGPDNFARFSPDGSQVVFIRGSGGHQDAYRMAILGGEPHKVVEGVGEVDWSPDGRRLVALRWYSSSGSSTASTAIVALAAGGGAPHEVATVPGRRLVHPRWSADGRTVACAEALWGGAVKSNFLVDMETGKVQEDPTGAFSLSAPAWIGATGRIVQCVSTSPVAAVTAGSGRLVARELPGGAPRALFAMPENADVLDVLGVGKLVYDVRSARENLGEVALDEASRRGLHVLTRGSSTDRQPIYSPDGETVLFSSMRSGNLDLWSISTRTGVVRRVTDDEAQDWDPAFGRDGKRLYWSSNRTGAFEIWTAALDGSGACAVTRAGIDAENPTETADGRWVVYSQNAGASSGVWKVHPDGTGAERIVAGEGRQTDVSPDGRWVAYRTSLRQDRTRLTVASVADGAPTAFVVDLPVRSGLSGSAVGRPRWMPDGKALAFVGQDEQGAYGLLTQDFDPARDTTATRRSLYGFDPLLAVESFAIAPDGKRITIASWEQSFTIMIADHVPEILPLARSAQ